MLSFHFIFALLLFSSRLHCSVSSSRSSCSDHPAVYLTASSEHGHLIRIPPQCLLMLAHPRTFYGRNTRFFALLILCGDIELNPGPVNFTIRTLNIHSILHPFHSAALLLTRITLSFSVSLKPGSNPTLLLLN